MSIRGLLAAALSAALLSCTAGETVENNQRPAKVTDDPAPKIAPLQVSETRQPTLRIAEIAAMPAGSWLQYGQPWRQIDPGRENNCGTDFGSVLGAWNGVVWDGSYVWSWAAGGHGDGCFNGIIRYDLQSGQPEMVVPHLPLNVPLCRPFSRRDGSAGCYWDPYVSDTPYPGGMSERVASWDGAFLRPRSSHIYNNIVKVGDWIYLATGHIYESGKRDAQVWRFKTTAKDIAATIERLPDRFDPNAGPDRDRDGRADGRIIGGFAVNWLARPGKPLLMFSGRNVCEVDPVAGRYDCSRYSGVRFTSSSTLAWDEERQGIWVVDSGANRLAFVRESDGKWAIDDSLSVTDESLIGKATIGSAGICLVPTENGANPVIWGKGSNLLRWDGRHLLSIELPGGPGATRRRVFNKWTWNQDLGVCLGTWTVDEGIWAYKPDFDSATPAAGTSAPEASPEQAAAPKLAAPPRAASAPIQNIKDRWWIDPADYPVFAGHRVAPTPWQPAPWNERIERQPEAPDYDALCPGRWAELHYRSEDDLAKSKVETRGIVRRGTPNVRIYLHPLVDDAGRIIAYSNTIRFNQVQCAELIGVPKNGNKPQMTGSVGARGVGFIVRGVTFEGRGVNWKGNRATNKYPAFVVLHDLDIHDGGSLMGDSRPKAPLTYLEFRGNVFGPETGWHGLYLERSIGQLVALSNMFYGSGRINHAFKNLAHQSRLEGNVFSNVGLDGQALVEDERGRPIVGLFPLDLYLCTETVIRNNTVLFRTSDSVRSFMAYRGRRAWGNCDKGQRLDSGRWALWPPEDPQYDDPGRWAEIAEATSAFQRGYEAAKAEPWLFTHKVEGNRFIVFNARKRGGKPVDDTRAAKVVSLRPVADDRIRKKLVQEAGALSQRCATEADPGACMLAEMSAGLRYAYDHMAPRKQRAMVAKGALPRGVPIPAPEGWVERAGVFWGKNFFITCTADGKICNESGPRAVELSTSDWDPVQAANPPRVIHTQ